MATNRRQPDFNLGALNRRSHLVSDIVLIILYLGSLIVSNDAFIITVVICDLLPVFSLRMRNAIRFLFLEN